jgi:hypothetical protein
MDIYRYKHRHTLAKNEGQTSKGRYTDEWLDGRACLQIHMRMEAADIQSGRKGRRKESAERKERESRA